MDGRGDAPSPDMRTQRDRNGTGSSGLSRTPGTAANRQHHGTHQLWMAPRAADAGNERPRNLPPRDRWL